MKRLEEWTIAYRNRNGDSLLIDDQERAFTTIKNTWRYWCADPHLLERDGRTYVFAELYDRVLRRGVIGYCELCDGGCTPWRVVLKMPWHLSYPQVFVHDDAVYMIPESYAGNEIAVYKATDFPRHWEKAYVLKSDCVAVDSTLFCNEGRYWMQTLQFIDDAPSFNLYTVQEGGISELPYVITHDETNIRPAGGLFTYHEKLIRPAQDCSESYGCALNFYHVTQIAENKYEERLIAKIRPSAIKSDFGKVPQGIHTYNVSEKYEIIDLKEYAVDWLSYIMRPIWFAWRRGKKLFGR